MAFTRRAIIEKSGSGNNSPKKHTPRRDVIRKSFGEGRVAEKPEPSE